VREKAHLYGTFVYAHYPLVEYSMTATDKEVPWVMYRRAHIVCPRGYATDDVLLWGLGFLATAAAELKAARRQNKNRVASFALRHGQLGRLRSANESENSINTAMW
jgi:hypothetical protein